MTDLNLAELDRLEREAQAALGDWMKGSTDDAWEHFQALVALDDAARNQLRPLLELVDRMGGVLQMWYDFDNIPGGEFDEKYPWLDTGNDYDSRERLMYAFTRAPLDDYRRAKGE